MIPILEIMLRFSQTEPPPPPPREWHDIALLALLIVFYLMKGLLISRGSALGWAFCLTNLTLAALFFWSIAGIFVWIPPMMFWVGTVLRALLVVFVVGSIVELSSSRYGFPSPGDRFFGWIRQR
jgi:hypothetical protein